MPVILNQEDDEEGSYNIFSNTTKENTLQTRHQRNIVDYNHFPNSRLNKDLRNATGENEIREIEEDNMMGKIHESFSEEKRGVFDEPPKTSAPSKDPRDLDGDGEVSWSETIRAVPSQSYESVKSAVSQAGAVVQSGVEKSISGAKKVALSIGDVDGDGDIDINDLGEAVRSSGHNIREATGINAVGEGLKDSGDKASSQLIWVGGAVVLAYLLIKS